MEEDDPDEGAPTEKKARRNNQPPNLDTYIRMYEPRGHRDSAHALERAIEREDLAIREGGELDRVRGVLKGEGASATTAPKCTKVLP